MKPQKSIVLPVLLAILGSGIVFGGGGYYLATTMNLPETDSPQTTVRTSTKPSSTSTTSSIATAFTTDETASWKTYTNSTYKFSFKYPADWITKEKAGDNYDSSVVSLISPEVQKNPTAQPRTTDIDFYYFKTISEESSNKLNNLGAQSLADYVKKDSTLSEIKDYTLGGIKGYIMTAAGNSAVTQIMIETSNKSIYVASLSGNLGETEKKILATFQITK